MIHHQGIMKARECVKVIVNTMMFHYRREMLNARAKPRREGERVDHRVQEDDCWKRKPHVHFSTAAEPEQRGGSAPDVPFGASPYWGRLSLDSLSSPNGSRSRFSGVSL